MTQRRILIVVVLLLSTAATRRGLADDAVTAQPISDEGNGSVRQTSRPSNHTTPPMAGYKKGFFIHSPDKLFKLTMQGRVQARYAAEFADARLADSAFSIPRARLTLKGQAFSPVLGYKFQTDFGKGQVALKDFFVDVTLDRTWLRIRVGQWKRPFARQQLTSSGKLEMVDRAITDKAFGAGRDIGLAFHNGIEKSPTLEYAVGVFDGTGDKGRFKGSTVVDLATGKGEVTGKVSNVPSLFHPALVARVGYNHGGIKGYSEADLEGGGPRVAVGSSARLDLDVDGDGASWMAAEVDYAFKAWGFASTGAVYLSGDAGGAPVSDLQLSAVGAHAEVSYLIADLALPSLRYAGVSPAGKGNDQHEILLGLSVFPFGHSVKLQADAGVLLDEKNGVLQPSYLVRSQLQLAY